MNIAEKVYEEIKSKMEAEGVDPFDFYYSGGYDLAIEVTKKHGGSYIYNSNAEGGYVSFAPTYIYRFPDGSLLRVTYSGCWVEKRR
ncbi:MAG: hypothetical protein J7K20_02005 [Thermodesulfobacterium sp.]|nr:hypothetical protein [Thermodesulfobacterium sp.]